MGDRMSTINVNAIDKESGSTLTLGGAGTTLNVSNMVPDVALSNRNLIINGAMQVAQRGIDVAWASNGYLALDRFTTVNNNTAGRFSMKQTADGPSGFANCLEIDVTTDDTSIAANEHMLVGYKFEGQDLQQIAKGTADAKQITLSFYVKGNGNATYMCELFDRDNTRLIHQQFSVTSSWNRVELTFAADTTGAFNDDNLNSLDIQFWLHAGSDFTSGTYTANTWGSQVNANRAVGISSIYSSTSNYFRITGLQLEVGSVATPFEHRSYGQEIALCQRYYEKSHSSSTYPGVGAFESSGMFLSRDGTASAVNRYNMVHFAVRKRTYPTITLYDGANTSGKISTSSGLHGYAGATSSRGETGAMVYGTGFPSHYGNYFHWVAESEL